MPIHKKSPRAIRRLIGNANIVVIPSYKPMANQAEQQLTQYQKKTKQHICQKMRDIKRSANCISSYDDVPHLSDIEQAELDDLEWVLSFEKHLHESGYYDFLYDACCVWW